MPSLLELGSSTPRLETESLHSKKTTQKGKREKRYHCMDPLCKHMMVAALGEQWDEHRQKFHTNSNLKEECTKRSPGD